ncbi:APC family permease [Erysipelothrix rhusiopathiae]|uniref:APC family permease n=1 Tax=Erysipelothrix rhusiopathiae TaxID=1648 RepID=UPI000DFB1905|nr:APC family permease [Erysipelothrix rhusiopathiae]MCG4456707.1 APC family permease [Erysipelothrix rhusiopathiae]MDE8256209.1 APC family permease [Erysipelothrix rhusiopathiae]MDE8339383.1 APC family permease [Erysipelothrix rhusiopathiae]MDE8340605.1 APC family permease [Erysipelothrix rhusiopathiae]RNM29559.1 APC family permease [Erysipelothrix rhusiopathiae]
MRKRLSKLDILALALGSIIGWGSFTLPGTKFLPESGVINTAIGLILGGIAIIFIVQGYHVMMSTHHEDGGEFSYTYNNLGKKHGFIVGWFLILCYISMVPLNATAFVLVVKKLFGSVVTFGYLYDIGGTSVYLSEILIASSIIIVFAKINIQGLKMSSKVQNVMILLTVANIMVIFTMMLTTQGTSVLKEYYITPYTFDLAQIAKVFAIAPFLFVGFDVIPQVSTDLDFSASKAVRVTILAVFAGVVFYNLNNITTALVFAPQAGVLEEWALGSAVLSRLGFAAFILLLISLAGAVSGGINGFMLGGSKLIGALAQYKLIPEKYNYENQNGMYTKAIRFITIVSLVAPWFGREMIIYIVDMSSLLAAIVYFYVCMISYRKSIGYSRKLSAVGAFVSLVFMGLLVIPGSPGQLQLPSFIFMIIWSSLGVFYYFKYQ